MAKEKTQRELFDERRSEMEQIALDNLYSQLIAKEGDTDLTEPDDRGFRRPYRQGEYKTRSFHEWLEKAKGKNNGRDILGDYKFSPEEEAIRKVNNPFAQDNSEYVGMNNFLRDAGHMSLLNGYREGSWNNRQFPDEVERYQNPHTQKVVDQTIRDMRKDKQDGIDNVSSQFIKAGAHNSKNLKPNAENKYDRAMEQMIMGEAGKLHNQGYQQAAQIFNADRLAREQNIANRMQVPFGMQKFERGQLGTLENLNNLQMYDRQAGLNAGHGRFREQHAQPFEDLSNLYSILSQGGYRPHHNYDQPVQQVPHMFQESKEGGRISIREMAEQLAKKGRHGDTELAHINPAEAAMLKAAGGSGSINPDTGLREYGIKNFKKWSKSALPMIGGALLGGYFGNGLGAIGGGALGGALSSKIRGRKDWAQAGLRGAIAGSIMPSIASTVGAGAKGMGFEKFGNAASEFGKDASILKAFGQGDITSKYGDIGQMLGVGSPAEAAASIKPGASHDAMSVLDKPQDSGFMSKMMGADKGYLDYAALLAPAALQGIGMYQARGDMKKDRADSDRREAMEQEALMRQVAADEARQAKGDAAAAELAALNRPVEDERRSYEMAKMKHEKDRWAKQAILEEKMMKDREARELAEKEESERARNFLVGLKTRKFERPILAFDDGGRVACFKEGGRVSHNSRTMRFASGGYVDGSNSGVKDNVRADLPEGAYVLDATTISLLGDGNSKAGAKKVDEFLNSKRMDDKTSTDTLFIPGIHEKKIQKQLKAGGELAKVSGRIVPAKISNGEYVLSPEDVILFSKGGSLEEGSKALDTMRERLKAQKGVKKYGTLPLSKPIEMYMRG